MKIDLLTLYNYRNYNNLNLKLSSNINIFTGFNAQGKTNIIEAIYFSSLGISHRTRTEGDLILWGKDEASINVKFSKRDINSILKIILKKNKRKELNFNGEIIKQKDLPGLLTMILFSPEDLMLIKGSPLLRRRFIDIELSQISRIYYNELVQYNRLLLQRNNLLKKIRENKKLIPMLDTWDEQIAKTAAFIVEKRLKGIEKLSKLAQKIHYEISQKMEVLNIRYNIHNYKNETLNSFDDLFNFYIQVLSKYRDNDIYRGSTSIGPHRDDIDFFINDISLKSFGSQGQQRSSVLSLKLAELEFLRLETGEYPILFLGWELNKFISVAVINVCTLLSCNKDNKLSLLRVSNSLITSSNNKFFKVEKGIVSE